MEPPSYGYFDVPLLEGPGGTGGCYFISVASEVNESYAESSHVAIRGEY